MTIDNYNAVRALWQSTPGVGLDESDEREPFEKYLDRNPGLSTVAVDPTGQLIGAVLCGYDGRRGYLSHLAVASQFQRNGVGRLLVQHCLNQLSELGVLRCNVRVFADNPAGAQFWRRLGFNHRQDLTILQRPTS